EVELEHHELAELLDRALALLPATTRQVLVARYVHDSPHAEIAARLGLSTDAVSMRLTRGKLLLRRALTADLREEATAYGFCDPATDGWQQTRIWCPQCGRHRLTARFPRPPGTVSFRCPACHPDPEMTGSDYRLTNAHFARLIGGLTRPRTILKRTAASTHAYYRKAIDERAAVCTNCGRPAHFRLSLHDDTSTLVTDPHLLYVRCAACGEITSSSFGGLVMSLPEVQRFWAEHHRIRTLLPQREVEIAGHPALVTRFESVTDAARLDVVSRRDTLMAIHIHGAPALESAH
ncbi:MAG TPA: sigma-70 family RNA polymerase sigma factor, partial [Chloroflexota bacterium]|nr:sigma-70 family RNA polymerase sigma factor [Chloroflexota bacterium]